MQKQDTIVLYPAPGMGHLISMVELAKLLLHHYHHQISITILLISTHHPSNTPAVTTYINSVSQSHPLITFIHFPPITTIDPNNPPRSRAAIAFEYNKLSNPHVVSSLKQISTTCNIMSFVIDLFCSYALSVAKELGIPTYYFFTSGAACLGAFLYFPKVHEKYNDSFEKLTHTVLHFPTIPPLKAIHLPEPILDRDDPAYNEVLYFCLLLSRADGIIVNTFEELESEAVKLIADGICVPDGITPPTYYIGPLIAGGSGGGGGGEIVEGGPRHESLLWLDKQPSKSVVFLCFGSFGSFSARQVKEIAIGLERSGQR